MKYARTAAMFFNTPLALHPAKAEEIRAFWETKFAGGDIDFESKQEPFAVRYYAMAGSEIVEMSELEMAAPGGGGSGGAVAVLPLYGVMAQRMNMMMAMSGGTSTQMFAEKLRELVNNPQVKAVIIDTDSPGGSVYGTDELATEIYGMRGTKPLVSVVNSGMFSAAYYSMSQTDEIVVTPGGELGSIGVIAMHIDQSEYNAKEGVKPTIITAGKYKAEGNPHEPLNDEAKAEIQAQVDRYYGMFLSAVARGRGVSVEKVRNDYGQGRIFGAKEAVRIGMADRVATLDQTITRFAAGGRVTRRGSGAVHAEHDDATITGAGSGEALPPASAEEREAPGVAALAAAARDRDLLQLDRDRAGAR